MRQFLLTLFLLYVGLGQVDAQSTSRRAIPSVVPVKQEVDRGFLNGHSYVNAELGLEISFPEPWQIATDDVALEMRKKGFDLDVRAPEGLSPAARTSVNRAIRSVAILVTAYQPGAVARVSRESLSGYPQIKDAVDYLDAVRLTYAAMKLPADFKYSETQAEKLGAKQYGFLDISNRSGKKRMYATVRSGHAVLFTLSYDKQKDLEAFRAVLSGARFR
ncbi:MAG: hypothetical protein WKF34_04325 [Pyrinomonadaceae bacterium]